MINYACQNQNSMSSESEYTTVQDMQTITDMMSPPDLQLSIDMGISLDLDFSMDMLTSLDMNHPLDRSVINEVDAFQRDLPPAPAHVPQFCFPILASDISSILEAPIIGVDHDRQEQNQATACLSHDGLSFPHCYDQHRGNDFLLAGGFDTMDEGSAHIVAAADGIILAVEDGHYDRCHADLGSLDVSCDGYPVRANYVKIQHEIGWQTWYYHFKKDSIMVENGQSVKAGDLLGLVGSSGRSAMPHLHFEIRDDTNQFWDPFAGEYSQDFSLWITEGRFLPVSLCPSINRNGL